MSIRVKFILIFLFLGSVIIAGGLWSFQSARQVNDDFAKIVDQATPVIISLEQLEAAVLKLQLKATTIVLLLDDQFHHQEGHEHAMPDDGRSEDEVVETEIAQLTEIYQQFQTHLYTYRDFASNTNREIVFAQIGKLGERNFELSQALVEFTEADIGKRSNRFFELRHELEDVEQNLLTMIGDAIAAELEQLEQQRAAAEQSESSSLFILIGSVLFVIFLLGSLAAFVTNTIAKPLAQLKDAALAIGRGSLETKIDIQSTDEIGELATVFNQMSSELNEMRTDLEQKVDQRTVELTQSNQALEQKILEHTQTEQTLQETFEKVEQSKQLLTAIVDANPALIFVKDRSFRHTLVNKSFADELGLDPKQVVGKDDVELGFPHEHIFGTPEEGIRGFRADDEAVLSGQTLRFPSDGITDEHGETRIYDTIKMPLYDDDGMVTSIFGISRDITKLKQIEEELRQSSLQISNIVKNVPGMIYQFILHPDGSVTMPFLSPTCKDLLGLDPDVLKQDATLFTTMPHPDDIASFQEASQKSIETLDIWEWTGRTIVNGEIKWLEGFARPKKREDGSILWDGLLTDITERKKLEDELEAYRFDLEARVVDRTERLMLINRISQELNNLLDLNQLLMTFINLLHDSLGLDYAQIYLIEKTTGDLCLVEGMGEIGQQLKQENYRLKQGQGIVGFVASHNEPFMSQNVREEARFHPNPLLPKIQSKLAVPLRARNEVIGVLDVQSETPNYFKDEDVSTLQAIADQTAIAVENAQFLTERQATISKLEEADQAKSQFITMISHELRTPLNAINGFAELLLMGLGGELSDDTKGDIQLIYNNGQHLLQLINDVIDISQIESGELQVSREALNVDDVVEATLNDSRSLVMDKSIEMVAQVDENLPPIWADSTRLKQILFNLVSNAVKFTDDGQITISATLSEQPPDMVKFTVVDTGIGIPADQLEQIFGLFQQVDMTDARKYGGLGVGLSVCKNLVDLQGGEIGVSSEEGVGSEFWFTMPIEDRSLLQV